MDHFALTVYFEDPFWVGVFEREEAGRYSACRVVFGGEPQDAQVYDLVLRRFHALRFSRAQRELCRTQRQTESRQRRQAEQERKYRLRQEKKREKRKGH